MAKVTLTGLLSTFGEPRVLLEIIEDAGKGGGTPKKPILREGEREGPVEVLAIDVVKNTVRLRNSGVETNVTFEVAKSSSPVPGGPGVPGKPPAFTPPPALNVPQPQQQPQPTIVSPNSANAGGGVTLMGGSTANATGVPSALGTTDTGMRTIPSRPLRTDNTAGLPPMTKEQADLLMEVNRLRGGPPAPPTSLTPIIDGAQQEMQNQGQQQNPYPRLPFNPRGGPPPLPGR